MTTIPRAFQDRLAIPFAAVKGFAGYFRFPNQRDSWGGPFNGQRHRTKMFHELQQKFNFRTIVETGTFRGTTTELFASVPGAQVYTVEAHPWGYGYCRARFFRHSNVTVMLGDSRVALRALSLCVLSAPIFFYLDAHWNDDLPLADELEIIFGNWDDAIVMIDDFKVEGDHNYAFDDYGGGKALCIDYIRPVIREYNPLLYFPAVRAEEETGSRRGSIVMLGCGVKPPPQFATMCRCTPT
jgi:hypothetical protein